MVSHCFAFEAIGTHWQIEIQDLIPSNYLIQKEIIKYCQDFDNNYSRFIPASQISEMAKKPGIYMVSPIFIELLGIFFDLFTKTNGFFTPLIGDVLDKAGYDSTYSFKYNNPTSPPPLSDIVEILDEHTVKINQPYVIDFGGIGKGFLIDKISFILQRHKVEAFSINGSGDIYCNNVKQRIGLENPLNKKQVFGIVTIKNKSICGSAGNRRSWGDFHHIINPKTLESPKDILATWVIAETATIADALATCLFLVSPDSLRKQYKFDYLILYPNFSIQKSNDFDVELFS